MSSGLTSNATGFGRRRELAPADECRQGVPLASLESDTMLSQSQNLG